MGDATQVHLTRWEAFLRASGYDTLAVSLEPVGAVGGRRRRIRIPTFMPRVARYTAAIPFVRRIVRDFNPHLINAHFVPNYGVIAASCGFRPWVLSTWGSDIMVLPDKSPFHMARTRWVIERATAITSDAHVMTRRLIELGASPERVVTFPMGVDRSLFYPSDDSRQSGGPRVLSNRKLEAVYNVETIVACFARVIRSEPGASLTVAGDGDLASKLRANAARTMPAGSVEFVGHVAHDRLGDVLRRHDIYVSTSLSDTTSVSLLEAMACGLFPIVSDIPANHEWIEHGRNGLLVPPRDADRLAAAIIEAWGSPDLRSSAAAHNSTVIEERADWQSNMGVLMRLFDRLLESA